MNSAQEIFEALLQKRGISKKSSFLKPDYKLGDPMLLPDIKPALKRIEFALKNNEKIYIYGDYDIDGLTATTLLIKTFKQLGAEAKAFIPDRFKDGYGLNKRAIGELIDQGAKLIITVDTGSIADKEISYAKSRGVDVIVTDHHTPKATLPKDALAVINPKREDSKYEYSELAGVGVAFALVRAMQKKGIGPKLGQEKWLLDLVALGTVCDIVPLNGENRVLVYYGLQVLKQTRNKGLRQLAQDIGIDFDQVSTFDIGYRIGPRLNASGRLTHAGKSLTVLNSEDKQEVVKAVAELEQLNTQRRQRQKEAFDQALAMQDDHESENVPIFFGEDWNQGIVGIVASKLVEELKKPVFVLTKDGDVIKGSARSFGDFHLAKAIEAADKHIEKGGGHAFAAGVTLHPEKLADFTEAIQKYYSQQKLTDQSKHLEVDYDIELTSLAGVDFELIDLLDLLEPHGNSNEKPLFRINQAQVKDYKLIGAGKNHLKMKLADASGNQIDAIGFNFDDSKVAGKDQISLVAEINKNVFNGRSNLQLIVRKIINL